jgi:hypothetical protein
MIEVTPRVFNVFMKPFEKRALHIIIEVKRTAADRYNKERKLSIVEHCIWSVTIENMKIKL